MKSDDFWSKEFPTSTAKIKKMANKKGKSIYKCKFKDQTEVLVRAREASKLLGATELNRPEDIEIDPITGNYNCLEQTISLRRFW